MTRGVTRGGRQQNDDDREGLVGDDSDDSDEVSPKWLIYSDRAFCRPNGTEVTPVILGKPTHLALSSHPA